jgi:hypothetical protein
MTSVPQGGRGVASGVLLATALLAAIGVVGYRTGHVPTQRKVAILDGAEAFHFENLPSMVATSTTVVHGVVVGSSRGKVIAEQEVTYTRKLLDVQVLQPLAGRSPGRHVQVEVAGWRQVAGEAETEFRLGDELPVNLGDEGGLEHPLPGLLVPAALRAVAVVRVMPPRCSPLIPWSR